MRLNLSLVAVLGMMVGLTLSPAVQAQEVAPQPEKAPRAAQAAKPAASVGAEPAVEATSAAKSPKAQAGELAHDFGQVWVDTQLQHSFTIKNVGDAPLKIIKVKPACGCTVAGKHPKVIAPGESGSFPFKLNAKKLNGKFNKTIAVTTDDPTNKQFRWTLKGTVKHHVEMNPRVAQFGRVKADSNLTRTIKLTNNTDEPISIKLGNNPNLGCFKPELLEMEPGKVFELNITAEPPFKTGTNRTTINLETTVKSQPSLSIVCMATVPKRLELRPDRINLVPSAKSQTPRRINLTNNGDAAVNIVSAKATDDDVSVSTKTIEPGKRHNITVTFPEGYEPSNESALVLTTDDAETPELRVPIAMVKRSKPQKRERPQMKMLGVPAPEHNTKAHAGNEIQVGGKSDKVQFLAFYASWCGFCKRALPSIEGLHQKYAGNENVEVIAINLDDRTGRRGRTEEQSLEHYKSLNLTMPLILDSEKTIGKQYKVVSFPSMYVVGKTGVVEAIHVGAAKGFEKEVAAEIDLLLAGKTRKDFPNATASTAPAARPVAVRRPAAVRTVGRAEQIRSNKSPADDGPREEDAEPGEAAEKPAESGGE